MIVSAMDPPGPAASPRQLDPSALLRRIEDSGHAFAVIEDCVQLLKEGVLGLDIHDPAVATILKAHLLSFGSPTDVTKYFSLELLLRIAPPEAEETMVEALGALARAPEVRERPYHIERAMIRALGERRVPRALPTLAVVAARYPGDLGRQAALAAVSIVGSDRRERLRERLSESDLPEAGNPAELASAIVRALKARGRRSTRSSDKNRRGLSAPIDSAATSRQSLRPERTRALQRRLRGIVAESGRDPSRCGNCNAAGAMTILRIIPADSGGTDSAGNLAVFCTGCARKVPASGPRRARKGATEPVPQLGLF